MVKNPLANAGDAGLIPGLRRSTGERNGNSLQYSRLMSLSPCTLNMPCLIVYFQVATGHKDTYFISDFVFLHNISSFIA